MNPTAYAMLHLKPKSAFSWDFTIYDGETPIAQIDLAWAREAATVTIGGTPCRIYREPKWGAFVLEVEGEPLIKADKPSAFRNWFVVTLGDRTYDLKRTSAFKRTFTLFDGDTAIGVIQPTGVFTRKATVDLPETMPLLAQVFVAWLAVIIWKREAQAAASS